MAGVEIYGQPMRLLLALALSASLISSAWALDSDGTGSFHGVVRGSNLRIVSRAEARVWAWADMPASVAPNSDGTEPDPVLTPGAVRTTDIKEICGHRTGEFREVSALEKIAARRAYGLMSERAGWCAAENGCEIDHAIPLTVGGGNPPGSIANLWPQRPDGPHGFHVKDRCEAAAGRALCAGRLTVQQAQDMFRTDWIGHCAAFMGNR